MGQAKQRGDFATRLAAARARQADAAIQRNLASQMQQQPRRAFPRNHIVLLATMAAFGGLPRQ